MKKRIHLFILFFSALIFNNNILNASLVSIRQSPLQSSLSIVQSTPSLITVTPSVVYQGDTVNFTITAHNTHFKQGATDVKIYSAKSIYYVYPMAITVINDTTLLSKFCMYYAHEPALFSLCVENPGEGEMCLDTCINLLAGPTPPSYTITPNKAVQGQTVNFTIKGTNTHFLKYNVGAYGVSLYNPDKFYAQISSTNVVYVNDTLLTCTFDFNYKDSIGIYDVQIIGFNQTPPLVLSKGFTLTAGLNQPILKIIAPTTANQGDSITIRILSRNTHFLSSITKVSIGSFDAGSVHVINDSTLDADFLFTYSMTPGVYPVHVENTIDGRLILVNAFTLIAGSYPPSIKSISPTYARRGQTLTISVKGKNTSFKKASNQLELSSSHGHTILPTAINYISDTLMDATFSFFNTDSLGYYYVFVRSSIGPNMILQNAFTLYSSGASILSISPDTSIMGSTVQITAHCINSHYLSNVTTMELRSIYGGNPLSGSSISVINDSTLTGTFSFTNSNFNGKYSITINNTTDGTIKIDSAFMLNPIVGAPHIVKVDPNQAVFDSYVTVSVLASGTHFQKGLDTVKLSYWSHDIYPISMNIKSDTVIMATFKTPQYIQNGSLDVVIFGKQPLVLVRGILLFYPVNIPKVDEQTIVSVYPNPSDGIFDISLNEESAINEIEILDLTGRIIYRQSKLSKIVKVDLSSYSDGMYYVVLLGVNKKEVVKIIKQR